MSLWTWFIARRQEYEQAGDEERLRMARLHAEAGLYYESDPAQTLALFAEGQKLAEQLGEPWWAFFYEVWQAIAMMSHLRDYSRVLDLAVRIALEARKPVYNGHPWKPAAFNNLINAYVGIDPDGHAEPVREALAYLDAELPRGPDGHRYVMLWHWQHFEAATGRLEEAAALADRILALAARDPDQSAAEWHAVRAHCDLCWLSWRRGEWAPLAGHAAAAEEIARRRHCELELAEAALWQAVLARRAGDAARAHRLHGGTVTRLGRLKAVPPREYFDVLALFHELGGDLDRALAARDGQLAAIADKGQLAYECAVRVERCRLLAGLGKLAAADLEGACAAARKLRKPERALAEIARLAAGEGKA